MCHPSLGLSRFLYAGFTGTDDFVDHVRGEGPLPAPVGEVIESIRVLEACYQTIDPLL